MTARPLPVKPDWLVPGHEVITNGGTFQSRITRTNVDKVASHTFTLVGSHLRFRIKDLSYHEPGTWGRIIRVLPAESPEARKLIEEDRRRKLVLRAQKAVEDWSKRGTRELRLAAIAALQAVEDDE
jgi:hypothetical protein